MERSINIEILDYKTFIKQNNLKEVTNPIFFYKNNIPTSDGLLSNEIFGINKEDRGNTFAYIDLGDTFIHPLAYKIMCKLNRKIKEVIHSTNTFKIDSSGQLVESEDGDNGIVWFRKNFDRIKFKRTDSKERDLNIKFLNDNKDILFIDKMIVIPAFYRDVNTDKAGYVGVGEINKLYSTLLVSVKALKESSAYGLTLEGATSARVQEIILQIYNWFGGGTTIDGQPTSPILPSKTGLIRRGGLRKTTDYGSRLVMSAPNLRCETKEEISVNMDYSSLPLASVLVNFYPFILFNLRRFIDRELSSGSYPVYDTSTKSIKYVDVSDYQLYFSDELIQKQIDRFIRGFSNRFISIKIPVKNERVKEITMRMKGRKISPQEYAENKYNIDTLPITERDLTWCDLFYIAAVESVKDRMILITRYPIDTMYNQFPTKVNVASTIETEPMIVDGVFYPKYPKIRQNDIGSNTSNKFIDTINICNAYLGAIGGDYDGDQVSVKGIYSDEANKELSEYLNSNLHYIDLGGKIIRTASNEGLQSLYSLTLTLNDDKEKLIDPKF